VGSASTGRRPCRRLKAPFPNGPMATLGRSGDLKLAGGLPAHSPRNCPQWHHARFRSGSGHSHQSKESRDWRPCVLAERAKMLRGSGSAIVKDAASRRLPRPAASISRHVDTTPDSHLEQDTAGRTSARTVSRGRVRTVSRRIAAGVATIMTRATWADPVTHRKTSSPRFRRNRRGLLRRS
jgi:hypothetical protein